MNHSGPSDFHLRFWGVRGGTAVPGMGTVRYGGNTSCVALQCGPHLVVLDAGTGIRGLGETLPDRGSTVQIDILCSHTHLDHVCGVPWFAPLYRPETSARFWAANLASPHSVESVVRTLLSHPLNPDLMDKMRARLRFTDFTAGETLELRPGLKAVTAPLRHPGGSTGYRIEWSGRAVAYVTDTEHTPGQADANVLRLAAGADVLIFDASYSDAEYPLHVGWGHATWQEGIRIARAAGARRLVLYHHDSKRDDACLDAVAAEAEAALPGVVMAREGLEIVL